jgi:thiol:disulfide interchange protein|tara:strand:- start:81469 stop:83523 length:2055 start_codon:yes stop_codon:yes gene_type:complete
MADMRVLRPLLAALLALIAFPVAAQIVSNPHARVELQAGPQTGDSRTAVILVTPEEGWHTYWKNPGAAGVESTAEWTLPSGGSAGGIVYPTPSRFVVSRIMNYVFEQPAALLVNITGLPETGAQPVEVTFDYLVCDDSICVPENAQFSVDLNDVAIGERQLAEYRSALPATPDWPASFSVDQDQIRFAVEVPRAEDVTDAYFFPAVDGAIDYNAPQAATRDGARLIVETTAGFNPDLAEIPGVLKLTYGQESVGSEIILTPGDVPAAGIPLAAEDKPAGAPTSGATPVLLAFGLALLGGLFLNVMPCVFPILSLKALSLAKGGASPKAAREEATFYSAGVVLTVLLLGGALLALRAGGASIGWAFQLQDPRVVTFLLLLVTAIALNLAGLFELPSLSFSGDGRAAAGGRSGAFWTGALAAVVATPCTGPFMGAALGAALIMTAPAAMMIFLGLGLGLALPFLLIGFVPALRDRLPRPGPWMERMRRLLSLPMFATALALAWVLGQQSGVDGLIIGLSGAVLIGLALWWLGNARRTPAPMGAVLASLAVILLVPADRTEAVTETASGRLLASSPYSPERLAELRAEQTPAFLYFTADWCITCKVNEKGALSEASVHKAFDDAGIVTLMGDWTRADPVITEFLTQYGRAGVPLYVYFAPGEDAQILPQLLSADMLTALAKDDGGAA